MRKHIKKIFGLAALILALTACSSGSGEKRESKEEVKTETGEKVKSDKNY